VTHRLAVMLAVSGSLLVSACVVEETVYGNDLLRTCVAGADCDCEITGNCVYSCPGGGCTMRCLGAAANCVFSCEGGGCDIECAAGTMGNCTATCTDGCAISCANTGTCSLTGCETGTCSADCANAGIGTCVCTSGCTAAP
jgi:hypothetical protein